MIFRFPVSAIKLSLAPKQVLPLRTSSIVWEGRRAYTAAQLCVNSVVANCGSNQSQSRGINQGQSWSKSQSWSQSHDQNHNQGHYQGQQHHQNTKQRTRGPWNSGPTLALSTFAFSQFDREDDSGDTREQRMLQYSLSENTAEAGSLTQKIILGLDKFVWEPLCTFLRFIQLLAVFLPVMLALPMVLVGPRMEGKDKQGTVTHGARHGAILWYRYLTWAMEAAGPSFIKLGQWAASRTDIFPEAMCEYMGKLHSKAKKHAFKYTQRIIKAELGADLDTIFADFPREPIGIGAMGQVYNAKIDGKNVVVKVLHPGIERVIRRDLKIMSIFANFINALPTMEWLSLPGEVETFGVMMMSQLDLRIEAENLRIFRHNFQDRPNIAFPTPYTEHTTRSVMVEELIEAVPMERILKFCDNSDLDHDIASLGLDAFLKMLLIDNFIHADLHPGNIMIRFHKHPLDSPQGMSENKQVVEQLNKAQTQQEWSAVWSKLRDNYQLQVVFIDAGLVTELREKDRRNFIDLFLAIATFDGYKAGELMVERSRTPETVTDADVFAMRTQQLVDKVKKRTFALGSVKLGDLLTAMLGMVRTHHVRMESDFITVVLSILLLEGIGRQLNPDLDIFKAAIPILREVGQHGEIPLGVNAETIQMLKVWLVLEARQFVQASIKDVHRCVKYDLLSPNQ